MSGTKSCGVISRAKIRDQSSVTRVGRPKPRDSVDQGPRIELIREGNIVKHVNVYCSCGEVITLECSYASDAT